MWRPIVSYRQHLTSAVFHLHHLQYGINALYTHSAWSLHMNDGSTVLDLTFILWALTCQHTSAGVNCAHGVRDSHDKSGELGSERRFSMGSAAPLTSASIESGWVRLRGWCVARTLNACSVRSRDEPAWVLTQSQSQFTAAPARILARRCFRRDSDWFRLDVHSVYRLFSFDRESLYLTAESLRHGSAWTCRPSPLQSEPASGVACHLMPAAPADARAATSAVGQGTGHQPSASVSLPSSFFSLLQSLCLTPSSLLPRPPSYPRLSPPSLPSSLFFHSSALTR